MFHSIHPQFHNTEELYAQIYQSHPQHPFPSPSPSPPSGPAGCKRKLVGVESSYTRSRTAANLRERKRMQCINDAFEGLRKHIPTLPYEKRLSKVDTLRLAICYINFLSELISSGGEGQGDEGEGRGPAEKRRNNGKVLIYNTTTFQEHPTDVGLPPLKGHSLSWSRDEEDAKVIFEEPQRKVKCVRTRKIWHPEPANNVRNNSITNKFPAF